MYGFLSYAGSCKRIMNLSAAIECDLCMHSNRDQQNGHSGMQTQQRERRSSVTEAKQ